MAEKGVELKYTRNGTVSQIITIIIDRPPVGRGYGASKYLLSIHMPLLRKLALIEAEALKLKASYLLGA